MPGRYDLILGGLEEVIDSLHQIARDQDRREADILQTIGYRYTSLLRAVLDSPDGLSGSPLKRPPHPRSEQRWDFEIPF